MNWSHNGTMIFSMLNYLHKIMDDFPEVICSTSATYAVERLFTVRDDKDRKMLTEDQTQHFHHTLSHLLFLCMRYRPYIQPLVDFLATRVRSPHEDGWGKLKWGPDYLKGMLYMNLYLHSGSLDMIF